MQTLVLLYLPDTSVTLAEFILVVGGAVLLMSLIPTLHHLRRDTNSNCTPLLSCAPTEPYAVRPGE